MKTKTRKIKNRSGKFPCDICTNPEFLETHHIEGRNIPNSDHQSNLADICANCHTKVHRGLIVIEKWTYTTNGVELLWHNSDEESFTGEIAKPYLISQSG